MPSCSALWVTDLEHVRTLLAAGCSDVFEAWLRQVTSIYVTACVGPYGFMHQGSGHWVCLVVECSSLQECRVRIYDTQGQDSWDWRLNFLRPEVTSLGTWLSNLKFGTFVAPEVSMVPVPVEVRQIGGNDCGFHTALFIAIDVASKEGIRLPAGLQNTPEVAQVLRRWASQCMIRRLQRPQAVEELKNALGGQQQAHQPAARCDGRNIRNGCEVGRRIQARRQIQAPHRFAGGELESLSLQELRERAAAAGIEPRGHRRHRATWIAALQGASAHRAQGEGSAGERGSATADGGSNTGTNSSANAGSDPITHCTADGGSNTGANSSASSSAGEVGGQLTTAQIHELMQREITPEDYEVLLLLDERKVPTLTPEAAAVLPHAAGRSWVGEECMICLCKLEEDEEAKTLPCGHNYHSTCIVRWLTCEKATCPICTAEVSPGDSQL